MREGSQSRTARKVALNLLTLAQDPTWRERLGPDLLEATRAILLHSGAASESLLDMAEKRWALRIYELIDPLLPGQIEAFGHRKLYFERQVRDALRGGRAQVLVLGAGFDSLCYRLAKEHPELAFVEVDHPATSSGKRRAIETMGLPANLSLIAADLAEISLAEALSQVARPGGGGWDQEAPSVACAEGLTMYLSAEENRALLRGWAALSGPGSRFVMTHLGFNKRGRIGADGFAGSLMRASLRLIGEPFRWAIEAEDLPAFVEPLGFSVLRERSTRHGVERFAVLEKS